MKKKLEDILGKFLSSEQLTALKEELASAARHVGSRMNKNDQLKARKEEALIILKRLDDLIENSGKTPFFLKAVYAAAKVHLKQIVLPLFEEAIAAEEDALDAIPAKEKPATPVIKPEEPVKQKEKEPIHIHRPHQEEGEPEKKQQPHSRHHHHKSSPKQPGQERKIILDEKPVKKEAPAPSAEEKPAPEQEQKRPSRRRRRPGPKKEGQTEQNSAKKTPVTE